MRFSTVALVVLAVLVIAEVSLLAVSVGQIGLLWTLLLLVVIAGVGGYLLRLEGAKTLRQLAEPVTDAKQAGSRLTDAGLVALGGVLLMLPGFLSDIVALFCLIPTTRPLVRKAFGAAFAPVVAKARDQADLLDSQLNRGTVIQGETVDPQTEPRGRRPDDDTTIIKGEIEP